MADAVTFRTARRGDLAAIVVLLADDDLGAEREVGDLAPYEAAFADIDDDLRHRLLVGDRDGEVVACLQLTVLPCLTHGGRRRGQIEGVRVRADHRGSGVGGRLLREAVAWCAEQGCGVVQLTTDKRRPEALRFYRSLGFEPTHEGCKLVVTPAP